MAEPPMVCYTRDKNLRDILVRAVLPPPTRLQNSRSSKLGFVKCGKRGDCILCSHSDNSTLRRVYLPDSSVQEYPITSRITCTDTNVIYVISCEKDQGRCKQVHPQYVGETGHSAKWRCARHIGTITNPSQENTTLPVGTHFRMPGHSHCNLRFLPIEKIESKDPFVRKVRESFYIRQYQSLRITDELIQHGLNLQP